MGNGPSIVFQVDRDLYGLETRVVKEIILVPKLLWNHSLPTGIAGVFGYRGTGIFVLNLHQWFSGLPRKLRVSDQVVIVEWQRGTVGLLVDKVHEVTSLEIEEVDGMSSGGIDQVSAGKGVVGLSRMGSQSAKVLDLNQMLHDLQASATSKRLDSLASEFLEEMCYEQTDGRSFVNSEGFEELTQEDIELLQERAELLAQSEPEVDSVRWVTLVVVRVNSEYLGLDPLAVREFAEFGEIVPIPCCPNFVLGHMNLRGEVLTVFDLRQALNMPIGEEYPPLQVVVIQFDKCQFGIAVQEVLDCVSCQLNDGALSGIEKEGSSFTRVLSQYQGKALKYLDLSQLISSKVLEVYGEV